MYRYFLIISLLCFLFSCNGTETDNDTNTNDINPAPPLLSYNVIKVYPHDTSSYTEGLVWYNNSLYESGGNYGKSKLFKANIETGKAEKEIKLDKKYFGEGITILNNKIYQLTWQEHKMFVYDPVTFKKLNEFTWPYDQGWGMTNNGKELIISTGSSNLYFVNPDDLKIIRTVGVSDNYGPVGNVNELEFANGVIYANVYLTNNILRINPETGKVLGKLDLAGILGKSNIPHDPAQYDPTSGNVLNGIAFDSTRNSLYVTGKYWPALFEIKIN